MNKNQFYTNQLYGLLPSDIEGFESLVELALNLRWSWNHAADQLWQQLDPALWKLTQNPWIIPAIRLKREAGTEFGKCGFSQEN